MVYVKATGLWQSVIGRATAFQMSQDTFHLVPRQDSGQSLRPLGTVELTEFTGIALHHFAVHEESRVKRLILRRGRDSAIHGQVRQECSNLRGSHVCRVPFVVKQIVPLDPSHVGLLGAIRQVLESAGIGGLVQKPWLAGLTGASRSGGRPFAVKLRL